MNWPRNSLPILLMTLGLQSSLSQHYPFRHFGTESGLPKLMIAGIAQDEKGFLWVGTSGGVCRFDGTSFMKVETTPSVDYFYAKCFLRDSDGNFWVGMEGNGLAYLQNGRSFHLSDSNGIVGNSVFSLLEDRDGNIWAGTRKGLIILRKTDRLQGNLYFSAVLPDVFAAHEVWRIIEDGIGRIWIATLSGVHLLSEGRIVRYWQKARGGRALARRPDGSILVQMDDGLYVSSGDSLVPSLIHPKFRELRISDIAWSGPILWCATYGQGLVKIEGRTVEVIGERNGLLTDNLYSIFVGAEETVWIGSIRGLSQLYELGIRNYSKEDGLIANAVQCFGQDSRGNIYVGGDQGISIVTRDAIRGLSRSMEGKPLRRVLAFTPAEGGSGVTAQLENGTAFHVSLVGNVPTAILMQPLVRAYTMEFKDRAGNQWVVKRNSGVTCVQKDGRILRWMVGDGYPIREVLSTFEAPDGSIWCGTVGDGMLRFKSGHLRQYTVKDGLPSNKVDEIVLHPGTQQLWIATNNGIARWRGDSADPQVETFPELFSLQGGEFGGIAVDRSGDLWFTSSVGVIRYDGRHFTRFSYEHGLLGVSAVGILVDQEGAVWVGGPKGASKILPDLIRTTHTPPQVIFSKIEAKLTDSILSNAELRYDDNDIRFQFFGLDLRYPYGMLYSYRLDGVGDNWSTFSTQNDVRFPRLAPGTYRFAVRAMNVRSSISSNTAEFAFSISLPYWQTWWFILICAAVAVSIAFAIHRYRLGQILKVERMRTRIAADLHDDIASSLSSVALYSDVIQRQVTDVPAETQELLGRIRDLSRESMEKIGLIVWSVDPRRDEASEVVTFFQRHAVQMCTAAGITFNSAGVDIQRSLPLTPEQRRTVYLILKEGLNNAIRHAACSKISFRCSIEDRALRVVLADNGKGFVTGELSHGHGLQNMHSRAAAIGGRLCITSTPGSGTSLELVIRIA